MELTPQTKQLIVEAKNISVIPSQTFEPESLCAALALFYTLKEQGKNVNLIIEKFPEKLDFLVPSLDFISQPKNFVISIPRNVADVSQVYYEKNEDNLKIHLTIDKGHIKKDAISLYFSQAKPDLVITLGIKNFKKEMENSLDSFGFILDSPILNIDSFTLLAADSQENEKFGKINIIEEKSIPEIAMDAIKSINSNVIKKNAADCLLTGMAMHYQNFKSPNTKPETLKTAAQLMEMGANYQQITENLQKTTEGQMKFLSSIFKNMHIEDTVNVASLESDEFLNFKEEEATEALEKIKNLGMYSDLLVLWKSHASNPTIKGFFYSKKTHLTDKISGMQGSLPKRGWIFITAVGENILEVKSQILNRLKM